MNTVNVGSASSHPEWAPWGEKPGRTKNVHIYVLICLIDTQERVDTLYQTHLNMMTAKSGTVNQYNNGVNRAASSQGNSGDRTNNTYGSEKLSLCNDNAYRATTQWRRAHPTVQPHSLRWHCQWIRSGLLQWTMACQHHLQCRRNICIQYAMVEKRQLVCI